MIKKIMILFVPFIFLVSCSTSQFGWKAEPGTAKNEAKISPYTEDFDPNSLADDDINPAMDKALIQSSKQNKVIKKSIEPVKASAETIVNGYRIQLLATKDENQAGELKKQAIFKFQEKVYLIFEAPFYRIRVGDCLNEASAKALRDAAVKKGFPDAWIVPSKVINRGEIESNP